MMKQIGSYLLLCSLVFCLRPVQGFGQQNSDAARKESEQANKQRDGQHDFDWEIGTWKIHIKRLQHPLAGSTTWSELDGTVVVRKIWDGRANLAEIVADGPGGHLEFLSLRLYNPTSHQWSLNFASGNGGSLSVPMVGEFRDGRGEFFDQEEFSGRTILVRFTFSAISANSGRSEQAFSDDGGKTWEVNWINTYTRVKSDADRPIRISEQLMDQPSLRDAPGCSTPAMQRQ
jgi:hypothetical protein